MTSAFPGQFAPVPSSFQSLAITNAAVTSLTLPTGVGGVPKYALFQVIGPNVNWRDDGVNPTNAVGGGMQLQGGAAPLGFLGNLATAKFISTQAAGSTLLVAYYY